uniref:FHA domain-containing protein n=1 Tax=Zooxanthella nutricula TaxID=1333877 RepID=A0A7S2KL01_9DINO
MRQWLAMRYSVENRLEGAIALSFKPPGCEICRTEFPATYQDSSDPDSEPVPLLTHLPLVQPPFIVLSVPKSVGDDRERPHGERCVFAPNGKSDAELRVGRQRDSELRLNDSSVSRVHARVRFQDGAFTLFDNNARFRTLVLPTGPEPLDSRRREPVSVQAGRTLLSFALLEDDGDFPMASSSRRLDFGSIHETPEMQVPTPEPEEQELQDGDNNGDPMAL